jgi:hypothetical protein
MTRSEKTELGSGKSRTNDAVSPRLKPGPKPRPIVEFPEPLVAEWSDCDTFHEALSQQMQRHGDSCYNLHRSISGPGDRFDRKTLQDWAAGRKVPNSTASLEMLNRIERRYRLPDGYFRSKADVIGRAPARHNLPSLSTSERRRLSWHLPHDFDRRAAAEQAEILEWIRTTMISGSTDYRRYQAEAMKVRYALRFPPLDVIRSSCAVAAVKPPRPRGDARNPSAELVGELGGLVRFKTATFTDAGMHRRGVWNDETAAQKIEHLGLMFGALTADPCGPVRGRGLPVEQLSLAFLAVPAIWDWYLQWRQERRGFLTSWELNMLSLGLSLVGKPTGWLRQMTHMAQRLTPVPGLLSAEEIDRARRDWDGTCDAAQRHGLARVKEIARVARVHRDPFEPILPILEDDSPVGAYRQITLEVLRRMPDRKRYPRAAAEASRSFLMLRFGLHLGVRQKNLRQLLVCPRTATPRTERQLEKLRRGELRWNVREEGWEVLIPSNAFKNSNSSFFGRQPFRLLLPNLDGLYGHIEDFIGDHRKRLLNGAPDPGTFFVKTMKRTSRDAAYNSASFYEAWRLIIQRYGIYNPYTGRGAIKGLLPHGPHNIRDVLATHVLKRTGSYEQASYAIQDTPEMVAQHYGRFLPQHKAALAAKILNEVWAASEIT